MLILTSLSDDAALRLALALGPAAEVVTVEELSFAARRTHWVSDDGARCRISLQNGHVIDDDRLTGVLNRLTAPPSLAWQRAAVAEAAYANAELTAFVRSWLAGLHVPVRNLPTAESLAGPCPTPLQAAVTAATAGLRVPQFEIDNRSGRWSQTFGAGRLAPDRRVQVMVMDGRPYGVAAPENTLDACRRMLQGLGAERSIVGFEFGVDRLHWWFLGLTPLPDLPITPAFTDALGRLLGSAGRLVRATSAP